MQCDCVNFRSQIVNLSKKILTKEDKSAQWHVLEESLVKYIGNHTQHADLLIDNFSVEESTSSCSVKFCLLLIRILDELRSNGIALSVLLVDLMAILHFENCAQLFEHWVWDLQRTIISCSEGFKTIRVLGAFRWSWRDSDFMKLLLNFGFLFSLPEDSPRLKREVKEDIQDFM